MLLIKTSKQHLKDVDKTYLEHLKIGFYYGYLLLRGAIASFIHGLIPGMFIKTPTQTALMFSEVIKNINEKREGRGLKKLELMDEFKKLI